MMNIKYLVRYAAGFIFYLMLVNTFAGSPLFTFTPLTSTTVKVSRSGTAVVQYRVRNQSSKTHTLVIMAAAGISQDTNNNSCAIHFVLNGGQSCVLSLQIDGSQLVGNNPNAVRVCQQKTNGDPDPLMCYQPSTPDLLNVSLSTQYLYIGALNGKFYYSTNGGFVWIATTDPASGSAINSIFATSTELYAGNENGFIYYSDDQGVTWNSTTQADGSAIKAVFVTQTTIYAGTANGNVFVSTDNGLTWFALTQPDGSSVNAIFLRNNIIYAGTSGGFVYYSIDNGITWLAINGAPDGSSIKNIGVMNNILYVTTANEYTYTSPALTGGGSWTTVAQSVYSSFTSASNNILYGGSQSGYVFSISEGEQLGFVDFTKINSIYSVFN